MRDEPEQESGITAEGGVLSGRNAVKRYSRTGTGVLVGQEDAKAIYLFGKCSLER